MCKLFKKERIVLTTLDYFVNLFKKGNKIKLDETMPNDIQLSIINPITFTLNKVETWRYKNFCKNHYKCNGLITLEMTETGIGRNLIVKCSHCKKALNITDYNSW